ncbi:WD40/YVTN/BNR-like repeat-containing protein [Bacillus sp. PS06]|uniref:WD40/YVTN/BNR-like repeat-containing protein n=1 Tax=Bacillus sp. PS06 TaxID=2764176 RepID=UPI001784000F|nr:oxidoreductase [Bacillus sp. PS06]MBD8069108.1 oxidoreductase [Bacillus sp. PS06]
MKKNLLVISSVMLIGLLISTVVYFRATNEKSRELSEPNENIHHQEEQNEQVVPELEELQAINPDQISYSLQNNELHLTFNGGEEWVKVPVEKDHLFAGEYNGTQQELIDNSYFFSENRVAIIYSDGVSWENDRLQLLWSIDQGNNWQETVVEEPFLGMRFRKVDFLNDQFGYIIATGERTMSSEASRVFLTHDGGQTWKEAAYSGNTRLLFDGGFVDQSTGFLSYGTINPEEPDFYVTQDGGETWTKANVVIPEQYNKIFVTAEVPVKEGDHLTMLVNQGPNGDYQGGKVKGLFTSNDNGLTWEFSMEVNPNE